MTNEKAMRIIDNADVYELAAAYSEYVGDELNDPDSALYSMWEFDELMTGFNPSDLVNMIFLRGLFTVRRLLHVRRVREY